MTRPIHIDSMINERIIPKDVVAYIEQLESLLEKWRKDYIEQGEILAEYLEDK